MKIIVVNQRFEFPHIKCSAMETTLNIHKHFEMLHYIQGYGFFPLFSSAKRNDREKKQANCSSPQSMERL